MIFSANDVNNEKKIKCNKMPLAGRVARLNYDAVNCLYSFLSIYVCLFVCLFLMFIALAPPD